MRINHNISAQVANISLKKTDSRLSASLERLSSGNKINKAADDAAGMAISNKMRTQIRALDQANRNAADGDSVIQTAEGALTEIESILQRIRELGVQAGNDTYTLEDRSAIQKEVDEMLDEIDRISSTTEFNGKGLIDGSAGHTMMSNTLSVDALSASMAVSKGEYKLKVTAVAEPATAAINLGAGSVILNGTKFDLDGAAAVADLIAACDEMNINAARNGNELSLSTRATGLDQQIAIQYADDERPAITRGVDAEIELQDGFEPQDTYSYSATGGKITIRGNGGFEMQIDVLDASAGDEGTLRVEDAGYMQLQIGANEHQILNVDFTEVSTHCLGLRDAAGNDLVNACTQHGATTMIDVLDDAVMRVSGVRSTLGAYQNRLEATQNNLAVSSENMTDAMSRIMDTDMASEMTEYTQLNVLSQAATSMLAQANNRPQEIMSLLQS